MTREEFADRIRWRWLVWIIGVLNPCLMLPQLVKLLTTGVSEGISLGTFFLLIVIQGFFSGHGFFIRDKLVMISNGAACAVTVTTTMTVIYLRYIGS